MINKFTIIDGNNDSPELQDLLPLKLVQLE